MPKNDFSFWEFKKIPSIEGEFIAKYPSVGPYKRGVYVIKQVGGGIISVWSYVQLHNQIGFVPFGTMMRITFNGSKEMPDKKGRAFYDFSVEILSPPKEKKRNER